MLAIELGSTRIKSVLVDERARWAHNLSGYKKRLDTVRTASVALRK